MAEIGPLLVRDRVLVIQGGLREDNFNGGYSLNIRQCWDFETLCAQQAQRLDQRGVILLPGKARGHEDGRLALLPALRQQAFRKPFQSDAVGNGQAFARGKTALNEGGAYPF